MQSQTVTSHRVKSQLRAIPNGAAGTKATLYLMSSMVRRYKKSAPLRQLALQIIRDVPGRKNFRGQIERIQNYVRNNIQYVKDINGVETVQTPDMTVRYRAGDCDDHSVLVATLLESIGHPTRFIAMKTNAFGPFVHVYTETKNGARWWPIETTENWIVGIEPPQVAGKMTVHN